MSNLTREQDVRLNILNSLLQSTHRNIDEVVGIHKNMISKDPLFYGHLACWAMDNTGVRDHKEVFVASLLLSEFPEHREAGFVLLQNFPPYQVERIKNHVKIAFKKNPPRIMKSAVKTYLKAMESNPKRFDGAAASRNGKALTGLYASFRLKPNSRAQAILFDNSPPSDSKMAHVRILSLLEDPVKQAQLIVEHNIPYTTAVGAIKNMTPTVLAALIHQMSDQEILVNLGALKKRGVLENADLKALVDQKLKKVKSSTKVDAMKAQKVAETVAVDSEMASTLVTISDKRLKDVGRISRSTALLIDKSGSMHEAIELGKRIGSMISTVVGSNFYCWVFDDAAIQIKCNSSSLDEWTKAFRMINVGGGTSCGAPISRMLANNQMVEQIIMVSDQDENRGPMFQQAMNEYKTKFGFIPRVVFVNCGVTRTNKLERVCAASGWEYDVFDIPKNADYYSLPNLLPLLSKPGKLELLEDILNIQLPTKADLEKRTA